MPSRYEGGVSTSNIICIVFIVETFISRVVTFTGTAWTQDYLNVHMCSGSGKLVSTPLSRVGTL